VLSLKFPLKGLKSNLLSVSICNTISKGSSVTEKTAIDGFVLCGGKATRLEGINGDVPKCLLKVQGRSVLGHLIVHLSPRLNRITVSYSGNKNVYVRHLKDELDPDVLARLDFELDPLQEGTARAVQRCLARSGSALAVINGDTLYDDFETVVPNIVRNEEIVFSTSYQVVDRGGEVFIDSETNTIKYFKNRKGGVAHKGWITNGILTLGSRALEIFKSTFFPVGAALEPCLLELQRDSRLKAVMYKTSARFMDIGTPEEFLDADECFRRLRGR
jgi:NDP-sugar pyrophosphorylase family protein